MVLCKIIHGDDTGGIVDLERPAAEAGQAMGTHRIMDPDERPPELPNNSEVAAIHTRAGGMTSDGGAADAAVAQPARDEDPRMLGTDHAAGMASSDAKPLAKPGMSKNRQAVERSVPKQPTMVESAVKPAVKPSVKPSFKNTPVGFMSPAKTENTTVKALEKAPARRGRKPKGKEVMLIRLEIGRNAGSVVDMQAVDAHNIVRNGTGTILTPVEVSEYALARAQIEEAEALLSKGTSPTPMAAVRQRTSGMRRFS